MEQRLAYPLLIAGWWFIVVGGIIFCGAVWDIISPVSYGPRDSIAGALMAGFGVVSGILFVVRSRKVLKGETSSPIGQ